MPLASVTRSKRITSCTAALLTLVWSAAAAQAPAGDPDARLQAIEGQLELLKKRVEALERQQPSSASPATPAQAPPPATPAACPGWDRLKMSMTQAEVRRLLGEPSKVDTTPVRIVWRYPCGNAYFDVDTRLFLGWSEP